MNNECLMMVYDYIEDTKREQMILVVTKIYAMCGNALMLTWY